MSTVSTLIFSMIFFYIEIFLGKQFYKWWQTKYAICFIIKLIVAIIWIISVIESKHFLLNDFNWITISQVCVDI